MELIEISTFNLCLVEYEAGGGWGGRLYPFVFSVYFLTYCLAARSLTVSHRENCIVKILFLYSLCMVSVKLIAGNANDSYLYG